MYGEAEYGVVERDEMDLYAAMDWLLERQGAIEKKLAARGAEPEHSATDVQQLAPTLKQIKENTGRQVQEFSADAGYCSEGNLAVLARHHVDSYIATEPTPS